MNEVAALLLVSWSVAVPDVGCSHGKLSCHSISPVGCATYCILIGHSHGKLGRFSMEFTMRESAASLLVSL